jgi:hypothetical protein
VFRRTAFQIVGEPRLHAIEVEHLVCPLMLGDDGPRGSERLRRHRESAAKLSQAPLPIRPRTFAGHHLPTCGPPSTCSTLLVTWPASVRFLRSWRMFSAVFNGENSGFGETQLI